MKRLLQALANAADGAFVVDSSRQVIFWNAAAETLTGFGEDEVRGRPCFAIMGGTDEQGRLICRAQCWVAAAGLSGRPVASFDTAIRTKANGMRWVDMSTFVYPAGEQEEILLVHLFRDATRKKQREQFLRGLRQDMERLGGEGHAPPPHLPSSPLHPILTPREREVLALLVRGRSTAEMAQTLVISQSTVRNHVRHIFSKLEVHSRLEAVAYAIQYGLVDLPDV
jgi:PAS domain S-box-containing protein